MDDDADRRSHDPPAWEPPRNPGLEGPYAENRRLEVARRLPLTLGRGPEDVAFDPDGCLLTGVEDGRILRVSPPDGPAEVLARTGGRPLGVTFGPAGRLLVADSRRGLLSVGASGRIEVLADEDSGLPRSYANGVAAGPDGTVYFTNPTERFGPDRSREALVENRPAGRLMARDARRGRVRTLLDGLAFPNGVSVDPAGRYLLVAETARYRVLRHWLVGDRAGGTEVFVDNLPGFPDGVTAADDGLAWVALPTLRSRLLDLLQPRPLLRRLLLALVSRWTPEPDEHGFVLAFDEEGRVVHNLQGPGKAYARVTNVEPRGSWLWLGSLIEDTVARVPRPG